MTAFGSPLINFLLASLSIGGLLFAMFLPQLKQGRIARQRLTRELGSPKAPVARSGNVEAKRRKRSIDETLREMEEKQQKAQTASRVRPTLITRMRQGGLSWSISAYWTLCVATGSIATFLFWVSLDYGLVKAAGFGLASGLYLPHLFVNVRRSRRFNSFTAEFPNAIDVIVRGVKAGMPLGDCLRIVAVEGQEPVRSEFKIVIDDQTIGMPMNDAIQRMAVRVPLPETNFLAIVVTIQSRAGGNLAEALDNLSVVLRERKKMRGKIRAMSAEAKASGGIIGALPLIVGTLVYLTSPDYIGLLFSTTIGNVALVCCALWMSLGIMVMRSMINFDF
jgi:tight adherence protein B